MTEQELKHVYGPVPSRRLGLSLGVDLVPFKTCTLDCIYCQLGRTTTLDIQRREFAPVDRIVVDIETALRERPTPDFLSLAGSGEPTLHSGLGELVARIREATRIPIALITNGTLLWLPEVRAAVVDVDVVLPSLDAGDEETFRQVNRPHPEITFDRLVSGLRTFRDEYDGQIWLEVFLVRGVTDTEEEVARIARLVSEIRPDRVQLNTAVRPTAEAGLAPVGEDRLKELAQLFDPPAEVVADFRGPHQATREAARAGVILEMVSRRPCTVADLATGLGLHANDVVKLLGELQQAGALVEEIRSGRRYFRPAPDLDSP